MQNATRAPTARNSGRGGVAAIMMAENASEMMMTTTQENMPT